MASLTDKALFNITFSSPMILKSTRVTGKTVCPTDLARLNTIMVTLTKALLLTVRGKALALTYLIKSIATKASGETTLFLAKGSCSGTVNYFLKANFKMDLNRGSESTGMKTETISKEITSKTKREERASTIFMKVVFCNRNSIQVLLKFPESN